MKPIRHRRFCRKAIAVACASAAGWLETPAAAQQVPQQDAVEMRDTIKIEVTGSNIRRSDVESALPVQVITREDIERGGFTTVAGVMASVSANVGAFTDALSVGVQFTGNQFPRPGLSSVNLRGIGDGSTLVLINGRRVANYAFDGGAVDVNSIPLAAIERVEILKDGASAIYGTDAIAGVVNFILRKDYRGVEATGYGAWTQQGGGDQYQATITAGYGDLASDKFNAFVTVNYQRDEPLRAPDRDFTRSGYRPDMGIIQLPRWEFPANIRAEDGRLLNPSFDSGCTPPTSYPFQGRCGSIRYCSSTSCRRLTARISSGERRSSSIPRSSSLPRPPTPTTSSRPRSFQPRRATFRDSSSSIRQAGRSTRPRSLRRTASRAT